MRPALLPLPLVLTALLAGCKSEASPPPPPRPVVSEVLTPQTGLQPSYAGTIAARTETDLGFPVAGTLAERPVEEGDVVATGALLARLDPQRFEAQARAAEAGVTVAAAQLNSARDAADRANQLVAKGVDSPSTAESAKSSLIAAQAKLDQAKASLAQAQQLLSFTKLTAPQDGVVTAVDAQPGAALTAGQTVLRLAGTGDREAVIDLSERDAAALAPGAVFRVKLEAAPQIATTATLRLIDPVTDPTTRTRRLHLTLDPKAATTFRLGALVLVEPGSQTVAELTLPDSALIGGKPAVWVVDRKTDTVHRVEITLGADTGGRVLVTGGLSPGQEVVLKGANSLKDGQTVGRSVSR